MDSDWHTCVRPGAVAQSPGREAALAWASLAQRFPASSVLAREGAGCGSVFPRLFQMTASALIPEHVKFCVCPLLMESLFAIALWLSQKVSPVGLLQSQ